MALTYTQITETFSDGTGQPLSSINVSFTPSQTVYAAGIPVVTPATPITAEVVGGALKSASGGTLQLLDTSNSGLTIEGRTGFWFWTVTITGQLTDSFSFFLPHSASPVDLYSLANTPAGGVSFLPLSGGTMAGWLAPAVAALTFGTTISVNAALGNDFRLTLTASTGTIANPTNPVDGQVIEFAIAQDATGSRTVAWGSAYDFGSGSAPTLSTAASKVDLVGFKYHAGLAKWVCLGSALGF